MKQLLCRHAVRQTDTLMSLFDSRDWIAYKRGNPASSQRPQKQGLHRLAAA
jgi:hypothetical protein